MQRVLSFQMARGLEETSEFVTKRMCISFIFSVGFLCLLCGFLLGRFATHRTLEFRAEKERLEFAGNGLNSMEHIEQLLLQKLGEADFSYQNWETLNKNDDYLREIKDTLANLSIFIRVAQKRSCILATTRGTREPDRYVILSVNGEGISIALELAKIFDHVRVEYQWNPRRSLIFCIFLGSADLCQDVFPGFMQHRIIAYVAIHNTILKGRGQFILSGSDVIQSTVLQAFQNSENVRNQQIVSHLQVQTYNQILSSDSKIQAPHIAVTYIAHNNTTNSGNQSSDNSRLQRIVLAQIIGQGIWKLSESIALRWNPKQFNDTTIEMLESIKKPELLPIKEKLAENLRKLVDSVQSLNKRMDETQSARSLDIRIHNDLLMDLDKALLCPSKGLYRTATMESIDNLQTALTEITTCYDIAFRILQDWK